MNSKVRIARLEVEINNLIAHVRRLEHPAGFLLNPPPVQLAPLRPIKESE